LRPPKSTTDSKVQAAWWARQGLVYFIAAGTPPVAIKIGVTSVAADQSVSQAVTRRLKGIQTSNHEPVSVLGVIHFADGSMPMRAAEILERELHIRFVAHQRFPAHSRAAEWFSPSEELLNYIREKAALVPSF
jgi:hypothetical protein